MNMLSHPCRVQPLFELGRIVVTPGAEEACPAVFLQKCLARHVTGDWGCVCRQDALQNWPSMTDGCSLFSAYVIDPAKPASAYRGENTLWIITEADRSVTTLLLPGER
jgi:hypothetical protein